MTFKKGDPNNPQGFNKLDSEARRNIVDYNKKIKVMKKFTHEQMIDSFYKYLGKYKEELDDIYEQGHERAVDMIVIGAIRHAIKQGDLARLQWFMDKLFGEKPRRLDITTGGDKLKNVSTDGLKKILAIMKEEEKAK